jgi:hypothetical protein
VGGRGLGVGDIREPIGGTNVRLQKGKFVHNKNMVRKLVKTGNSVALILSKDMREHLGIDDRVSIEFVENEIRLRKPMSFEEAKEYSLSRYGAAYRKLAE